MELTTALAIADAARTGVFAGIRGLTMRHRVASAVHRRARSRGISVSTGSIRRWLGSADVREQLFSGDVARAGFALHRLKVLMERGAELAVEVDPTPLYQIVADELLRRIAPGDASVMARNEVISASERETDRAIEVGRQSTAAIIATLARDGLELELASIPAARVGRARELVATSPRLREFIHALAKSADRRATVTEWGGARRAEIANESPEVVAWLGEVAADYGSAASAIKLFEDAISRGVSDAPYWRARLALQRFDEIRESPEVLAEVLGPENGRHPLGIALWLASKGENETALEALEKWAPEVQTGAGAKLSLLVGLLEVVDQVDKALAIPQRQDIGDYPGLQLKIASLHLRRAKETAGASREADIVRAITLADAARSSRRRWHGDSAAAAVVLAQAHLTRGDSEAAWIQCVASPEGEATPEEAADQRVLREAAISAASRGRHIDAVKLAEAAKDPFATEFVRGWAAAASDDFDAAEVAWLLAWEAASDDAERLRCALALASLGRTLPDLSQTPEALLAAKDEIIAIHLAMSSDGDDRLFRLRAIAADSDLGAALLAEYLVSRDRRVEAGRALRVRAERGGGAGMMRMAAEQLAEGDAMDEALNCVDNALTVGGTTWGGRRHALKVRFQLLESLGRKDESLQTAQQLHIENPMDDACAWVLVRCLLRLGSVQEAWRVLNGSGKPIEPRDQHEATIWIQLVTRFDTAPAVVERCLDIVRRWGGEGDVYGNLLGTLFFGLEVRDVQGEIDGIAALQLEIRRFSEENPDTTAFRSVQAPTTPAELDAFFKEFRGPQVPDEVQSLMERVARGHAPLGMAASLRHRTYLETLIEPPIRNLFSSSFPLPANNSVRELLDGDVVVDLSALASIALAGSVTAGRLFSLFSAVLATGDQVNDARACLETFSMNRAGVAYFPDETGAPVLDELEPNAAQFARDRADLVVELLGRARARAWVLRSELAQAREQMPWMSAADMGIATSTPVWCDDLALASVIRALGGTAISTVEVLEAGVDAGLIGESERAFLHSRLIAARHVDIGFREDEMALAAKLDGWQAKGAALNLCRPATWLRPTQTLAFVIEALDAAREVSPTAVSGWVECSAVGLGRIAGGKVPAEQNFAVAFQAVSVQPWMTPELLRAAVDGIRSACRFLSEELGTSIEFRVNEPLAGLLKVVAKQVGFEMAARYLLGLAGGLEESDRQKVLHCVLTYDSEVVD